MRELCIFGSGGFAHEVYWLAHKLGYKINSFIDVNDGPMYFGTVVSNESYFNPRSHYAVIGIGSPEVREKIATKFNTATYLTLIDSSVIKLGQVDIGKGSVVCSNSILTCDIEIGDFAQLNLATTIGHDTKIGKFFTTAPCVNINGHNTIGNNVYFGSNSSTIEGISITDNVIVGAGACVVKDITEPGTYVGTPAKRIK